MLFEFQCQASSAICEEVLDLVLSISQDADSHLIEGITEHPLELEIKLLSLGANHLSFKPLEERNWLLENQKSLTPLTIGPYHIRQSCHRPLVDKIDLLIDAGAAFGSGHHESTQGCLLAFDKIKPPKKALDLGCGSGILAIALAKRFGITPFASDNDPTCIRVTEENSYLNNVKIKTMLCDGVPKELRFDCIVANILAKPLCEMAKELKCSLNPRGHLILSGLLKEQIPLLKKAYLPLHCFEEILLGGWATLIFTCAQV